MLNLFDKLEDRIRLFLGRRPMLYAFLGIMGIVLTWRGIWYLADEIGLPSFLSLLLGLLILSFSGLLVALAIGNEVLLNAFRGKKKVSETQIDDAFILEENIEKIKKHLTAIENRITLLKKERNKLDRDLKAKTAEPPNAANIENPPAISDEKEIPTSK